MMKTVRLLSPTAEILGESANAIRITGVVVRAFSTADVPVEIGIYHPESVDPESGETTPERFKFLASRIVILEVPEYEQWGDDDDYVFAVAAGKLGLSLAS